MGGWVGGRHRVAHLRDVCSVDMRAMSTLPRVRACVTGGAPPGNPTLAAGVPARRAAAPRAPQPPQSWLRTL